MAGATVKGGSKLAAHLEKLAKALEKRSLKVGFLAGATYPDGTPVAMVAAIQEFGAPAAGIPPRPFFRTMVAQNSPDWGKALNAAMRTTGGDATAALNMLGEHIAGQLRESIAALQSPPLSQVTLMLRMMRAENPGLRVTARTVGEAAARVAAGEKATGVSTKPLVDRGILIGAVDYEVEG